jgi:organic radical activating enzyme
MTEISPTFCSLAWKHLNTTNTGSCKLCPHAKDSRTLIDWSTENRFLNWSRDDIQLIWNGAYMQDVRQRMLDGKRVEDCEECYAVEKRGETSHRQNYNADPQFALSDQPSRVANDMPMSLELKLSNHCKLACMTCFSGSSSEIARLRSESLDMDRSSNHIMPVWLRNSWQWEMDTQENINRWQNITTDYVHEAMSMQNFTRIAGGLKRLLVTGGEPTTDPTLVAYLNILARETALANNHECWVSFSTNCTTWNDELVAVMSEFTASDIQLSIDGCGAVNDYMRWPSKWNSVSATAERYFKDTRVSSLGILTVVTAMNAAGIVDLIQWCIDISTSFSKHSRWWPILVQHPQQLRINSLARDQRLRIADQLEHKLTSGEWSQDYCDHVEGVKQLIMALRTAQEQPADSVKLIEHLEYTDRRRGKASDWKACLPGLSVAT